MNREDIIRMAREAGLHIATDVNWMPIISLGYAERFAKLVAEHEHEREQEPVAWGVFEGNLHDMFFSQEEAQEMADLKGTHAEVRPLYTTPPQRTWVGLTNEETIEIELGLRIPTGYRDAYDLSLHDFAKAIEAKLKEKNT